MKSIYCTIIIATLCIMNPIELEAQAQYAQKTATQISTLRNAMNSFVTDTRQRMDAMQRDLDAFKACADKQRIFSPGHNDADESGCLKPIAEIEHAFFPAHVICTKQNGEHVVFTLITWEPNRIEYGADSIWADKFSRIRFDGKGNFKGFHQDKRPDVYDHGSCRGKSINDLREMGAVVERPLFKRGK